MTFAVRRVAAADVYPLRQKVLRPQLTVADVVWTGDNDPSAAHFAAFNEGQIVGVASITIDPRPGDPPATWRLRGMATDPAWQGKGVGTQVLAAGIAHIKKQGGVRLWCNGRTKVFGFYRNFGFRTEGEEFITISGPHYVMVTDFT